MLKKIEGGWKWVWYWLSVFASCYYQYCSIAEVSMQEFCSLLENN